RARHLKELIRGVEEDSPFFIAEHLAGPVNILLRGQAPRAIAEYVAGARLIPLSKKGGGIRPIAVGNILRRLVSKIAVARIKKEIRNLFYPIQCGVAVPGGAEAIVEAVRTVEGGMASSQESAIFQ